MKKRPENSAFAKFYTKQSPAGPPDTGRRGRQEGGRAIGRGAAASERPARKTGGERPFDKRTAGGAARPFGKTGQDRPFGKRADGRRSSDNNHDSAGAFDKRAASGDRPFGRKTFSGPDRSDAGRRPFGKPASERPAFGKRPYGERTYEKRPFSKPDAAKTAFENNIPENSIPAKAETPNDDPFRGKRNRRLKDQYKAVRKPFDKSFRRDSTPPSDGRTQAFRRREDTGRDDRRGSEKNAGSGEKPFGKIPGDSDRETQRRDKPFGRRESGTPERKTGRDISYQEVKKLHGPGGAAMPEKKPFGREGAGKRPFDTEKRPFPKPFQRREADDDRGLGSEEPNNDRKNNIRAKSKTATHDDHDQKRPDYDRDIARFEKTGRFNAKLKVADPNEEIRLNRYIANAGVCARREADELIKKGEIRVNDLVVSELGYKVKPGDVVKYGGRTLNREKMVYVLLNKPKDFITTTDDPDARRTVMDLVKTAATERIYPVGRLDRNTTGLLLLTNDGELAEKLAHPSHKIEKLYEVELDKPLTKDDFAAIMRGVELEDGLATVDDLAIVSPDNRSVGVALHLGRNRIVRRIFEHLGYQVERLDRTMYAGLTKKEVPRGNWRYLTEKEVIRLKYFV